jgi:hypothetical protein
MAERNTKNEAKVMVNMDRYETFKKRMREHARFFEDVRPVIGAFLVGFADNVEFKRTQIWFKLNRRRFCARVIPGRTDQHLHKWEMIEVFRKKRVCEGDILALRPSDEADLITELRRIKTSLLEYVETLGRVESLE